MMGYIHGREAVPASARYNLLKTWAQTVVFWGVFLFLLPWGVWELESALGFAAWRFAPWEVFGAVLFALGGALGLTSGAVMAVKGRGTPLPTDCARELVIVGPYRFIRNPMAVAGLSQGVAVGLFLGSPMVVLYALAGGPLWHFLVRPWEETDLERRFGEPYRAYRGAVKCWLPRLRGYAPAARNSITA